MERFELIKNDVSYIGYCNTRDRLIKELQSDCWDVDHAKFMIWYLDEQRHKLDDLVAYAYAKQKEVENNVNDSNEGL